MNIQCKDESVLRACFKKPWHPTLIDLYVWVVKRYGDKVLLTEAWRPPEHPSDLHGIGSMLRAIDLRERNFEDPVQVEKEINLNWTYDPKRPNMKVAILHEIYKSGISRGKHFHLQVHPNTIFEA